MDIVTALAFGYIVYTLIDTKRSLIDSFLIDPRGTIKKWIGKD